MKTSYIVFAALWILGWLGLYGFLGWYYSPKQIEKRLGRGDG